MSVLGRADEPVRVVQEALQSDPQNEVLHLRLGQILVMANRAAEALEHVRQAIALRPEFLAARRALALALEQSGDRTGAAAQWEEILQAYPGLEEGYLQLARVLDELKDTPRMARILRQGLEHSPDSHQLANALAWIRAASADEQERNGQEAVEWAEKACALTNHQNPIYLDTLGVAYAEAGRFEDAVRVGRKAVELATAARNAAQAEKYRRRVELYEWKQPYHESD
jgi:Flp pilus assembly protein TadD